MVKKDFVKEVATKAGVSMAIAKDVVDAYNATILEVIAREDSIRLDFGTISGYTREARTARNPATGEKIEVPEKKGYPKIKWSKSARA